MGAHTSVESMEKAIEAINHEATKTFALHDRIVEFTNQYNWSDEKGQSFFSAIRALDTKLLEPMPSLKNTRDKIEHLKKIVEDYNGHDDF